MTARVCLWSGPRNVSTAVMYSFRQRPDTSVVDEPLYAHYLAATGVQHPAVQDVISAQDSDGMHVVDTVIFGPSPTPVRFFKHMAHHLVDLDLEFIDRLENVILTRDPVEMLPSLVNQVPNPTLEGTSLPMQVRLLDRIVASGRDPIVLDSRLLLLDPESVLRELCRRLGLDFDQGMLSWPVGPKPEDGVWAPHWYHAVHQSTGFEPYRPKAEPVPGHLIALLEECRPLYARLAAHAIDGRTP
jgi:hypothetical protein